MARWKEVIAERLEFQQSTTLFGLSDRLDVLICDSLDLKLIRAKLSSFLAMDQEDVPGSGVEAAALLFEWLQEEAWKEGGDLGSVANLQEVA